MLEFSPRQPESNVVSGLKIIQNKDFQIALANANYDLNAYPDEREWRIGEIEDAIMSHFPDDIHTLTVDFAGMGYEYDGDAVTDKTLYTVTNAEFLGFRVETVGDEEKILFQFLLPDSDDLESGARFCVDPIPEDIAGFEFHEDSENASQELNEELSRQAHSMQMVMRSKDFLELPFEAQQETLDDLSHKLIELFDFLRTNSRSLVGIKCLGYYCSPTELSDELDLDECYVDLGDNPDVSHYPEGKLMDVGLPERFLDPEKQFTELDDLYFSGGMPFIVLKPSGLEQYYWIHIKEIDGLVWTIDSPSQLETGISE